VWTGPGGGRVRHDDPGAVDEEVGDRAHEQARGQVSLPGGRHQARARQHVKIRHVAIQYSSTRSIHTPYDYIDTKEEYCIVMGAKTYFSQFMYIVYCIDSFCVVQFVMVPSNSTLTPLSVQFFFEHIFNLQCTFIYGKLSIRIFMNNCDH